jgi:hypothetical protein
MSSCRHVSSPHRQGVIVDGQCGGRRSLSAVVPRHPSSPGCRYTRGASPRSVTPSTRRTSTHLLSVPIEAPIAPSAVRRPRGGRGARRGRWAGWSRARMELSSSLVGSVERRRRPRRGSRSAAPSGTTKTEVSGGGVTDRAPSGQSIVRPRGIAPRPILSDRAVSREVDGVARRARHGLGGPHAGAARGHLDAEGQRAQRVDRLLRGLRGDADEGDLAAVTRGLRSQPRPSVDVGRLPM